MKITHALLGEHGLFYAYLDALEQRMDAADHGAVRVLAETLDALLRSHAQAEEDLLFPAMDDHVGEMGPLHIMRNEHQRIDRLLDEIRDTDEDAAITPILLELLELIHSHFHKEEAVLFHLADQFVDEAKLNDMGQQWAKLRKVDLEASGCAA